MFTVLHGAAQLLVKRIFERGGDCSPLRETHSSIRLTAKKNLPDGHRLLLRIEIGSDGVVRVDERDSRNGFRPDCAHFASFEKLQEYLDSRLAVGGVPLAAGSAAG